MRPARALATSRRVAPRACAERRPDSGARAAESLAYIRDELRKCKHMEPIYWQRREGAPSALAHRCPFAFPA